MNQSSALIVKSAIQIAQKIDAKALLLYIDPLDDLQYADKIPSKVSIYLVTKRVSIKKSPEAKDGLLGHCKGIIVIPKIGMSRISIIKVATMFGLAKHYFSKGDTVVAVAGHTDMGVLDAIQVIDTSKETEIITGRGMGGITEHVKPAVFEAVLNLSVELADKGREGKPVGTIFVVGDEEKVLQLSKQMIINPLKGYSDEERNIFNDDLRETIREFSAMDGAFVVSDEGILLAAGRYLSATAEDAQLPRGLGSRHMAAAGITALTKSVAFVISESSGDVRIFKDGKILMTIEKTQTKK